MNLTDDFELRYRFPKVHCMSHDGDINFMAVKPHKKHPEIIHDEGCLMLNRSDPCFFRKVFLQVYEENIFEKTTVEIFLTLRRHLIFDTKGDFLDNGWFLENRTDAKESDPAKIMMLVPAEWLTEALAIKNVNKREERRKTRDNIKKAKSLDNFGKLKNPKIGTVVDTHSNFNTVNLYSPLPSVQKEIEKEQFFAVGNEVNFPGCNNPAELALLSFQESFGNISGSE